MSEFYPKIQDIVPTKPQCLIPTNAQYLTGKPLPGIETNVFLAIKLTGLLLIQPTGHMSTRQQVSAVDHHRS